jgi:hypothetical protein
VTLLLRVFTIYQTVQARFIGSLCWPLCWPLLRQCGVLIQLTVDQYIARADRTFTDRAVEALVWIIALQIGFTIVETILRFTFLIPLHG